MNNSLILSSILILSIAVGQLIKLPVGFLSSATVLDLTILVFNIFGIFFYSKRLLDIKNLKKSPLFFKTGIIFLIAASVSLVFTPLKLSYQEYLISFSYTLRFLNIIFFGLIIYSGGFTFLKKIWDSLAVSGVILAIVGIIQLILLPDLGFLASSGWDPHYFRVVSTFLDPNFIGAFLILTLLLLTQIQKNESKSLKIFTAGLVFISLFATFSREAIVMFFVSFSVLALLKESPKLFILSLLLTSIMIFGYFGYKKVIAEPRNINRAQSAKFRLNSWQQGLTIFSKSPILGVGFNSYRFALDEYNLAPKEEIQSRGGSSNDSSLLFVAATTGFVGLFCYLLFLFSLFKESFKKPNNQILIAGLTGLIIQSFFANSLFYPFIFFWIIVKISETSAKNPKT